ncbi:hypothetical protein WJX75_005797 [Coccomyxa subellipsoidea]|uniref:Uncharacterized protein n=1 Tax=Coccomyxa subellipsoidea TaxID=248742 RepID=A0ABR2YAG5_9CHLO
MEIEEPIRKKRYNDIPNSYCCDTLANAVEDLGYIQYQAAMKEYTFADADGFPLMRLAHCPFCGAALPSLRGLLDDKLFEYRFKRKALSREEFDDYWPIIKQDLGYEETMRLIAKERAKREGSS